LEVFAHVRLAWASSLLASRWRVVCCG